MHLNHGITVERDNAPILSDVDLHRLGELYLANPTLRARGILFETFVRFPHLCIARLVTDDKAEHAAPLAPAVTFDVTREVRAMEESMQLHRRGSVLIEPLHHRRHYKPHLRYHNPRTLESSR